MTDLKNISTTCGCCAERNEAATRTDNLGCCGQGCCVSEDDAAVEAQLNPETPSEESESEDNLPCYPESPACRFP